MWRTAWYEATGHAREKPNLPICACKIGDLEIIILVKLKQKEKVEVSAILYSGKLLREKTFANLWLYAKVFSAKFGVWCPFTLQKRAIHESFLHKNRIFTNSH